MNSILGFNPASLSVFSQPEAKPSGFSNNIYKPKPAESKSTDGVYRSTIRVVYSPFNIERSILERQSYAMTDANGFFQVVSKLTNNDTSCPIFNAWKKCRYSKNPALQAQANTKDKGGNEMFDKRFERYVTVQVMEDQNHPELVGQYMFWKLPKSVYDAIIAKMNPASESNKAPIPVMDVLFGRAVYLEVKPGPDDPKAPERKTREISYNTTDVSDDILSCTNPDGSALLTAEEQAILDKYIEMMQPAWKSRNPDQRKEIFEKVSADPNTAQLGEIYTKVIEKLKTFCPDLVEELGYKDWTPEVTERVNNWITAVLNCQNPASVIPVAEPVAQTAAPAPVPPLEGTAPAAPADDLPF